MIEKKLSSKLSKLINEWNVGWLKHEMGDKR